MKDCSRLTVLAAALLLAGCYQSPVSLYGDAKPLRPFRTGKVDGVNSDGKTHEHSVLTKEAGGRYRLTNDEQGSSDFGDSFVARLFPLPGAPSVLVVFEAQERKNCKPSDNMCRQDPMFYYGLARVRPDSAEILNPDCDKDAAAAKLPGVKPGDYGTCSFPDRATLEKALLAVSREPWKPQVTYRLAE